MAIDPQAFEDDFEGRLQKLIDHCRALPPSESGKAVLVAGDPERAHMATCDQLGGIPYPLAQVEFIDNLARSLNIHGPRIR